MLMVVVPIALVVLTVAFVIAHLATPVGECSEGVVLGQLVVHRWDEPCRGDRNCPQTGPANRPRGRSPWTPHLQGTLACGKKQKVFLLKHGVKGRKKNSLKKKKKEKNVPACVLQHFTWIMCI